MPALSEAEGIQDLYRLRLEAGMTERENMKVSKSWLLELTKLEVSLDEVVRLLPLRTIGTKEITEDFIELDMKGYNRADLLSMRGVTYEVAAITDSKVNFDETDENEYIWESNKLPQAKVEVECPKLVPLYCIAKISGLRVEPSNKDWVKKLEDCGVRSVNNLADITNLAMLEYGQPMHAFDAGQVKDEVLIVRTAKDGEQIVTLDEKKRDLIPSDILICDSEKALGLAGVMGGKNCEVTDETNTILLEAAIFDPIFIRKTAQRLNLPSEASRRFQHGLTKKRLLQALSAAIKMYQDLGGNLEAISIIGDTSEPTKKITVNQGRVNSLIGVDIKPEDIENYLKRLYFGVKKIENGWELEVPYYRLDVNIEADVIEEIARMYGYEKIPSKKLEGNIPEKIDQKLFDFIYNLKISLVDLGLTEVQTYSFYSTKILSDLGFRNSDLIKVSNPMSSETEYLRDMLWPNLLEKVAFNLKQGYESIAIFEVGKVYVPRENDLPEEKYKLAIAIADGDDSIQKLYTIFQKLNEYFGDTKLEAGESELFHPVRAWQLMKGGRQVGQIGEVHPRITNKFGIEKRVAIIELEISNKQACDLWSLKIRNL
ncbi:MAG: Phenylalanine-tRNA ligase beta subunit [Candidatus Daviesbacteria bacterium GW2011_GWB1_41_5]|uniref:Phenylalanine--tRNA ligase beta subunit n=2 Tax=Candidatus Daviesiibacteriota TaxID=1752718 RepID=A0A0G0WN83_9BACT|nr:MAG: Phenylalanine-tRNA ligase beta subunit [Candidatus Daviesbacteria bacterium GW2011_GWB1_41_5]